MKKLLLLIIIFLQFCGDPMVINDKKVECYGLINRDKKEVQGVQYDWVGGNVFWGIILSETIAIPVWLFGFRLYCPTGVSHKEVIQ